MNAVSRERFTLAAALDAVTLTYRRATIADFYPTYSTRTSIVVPSMWWGYLKLTAFDSRRVSR